ncbi:hypothetical protein F0562_025862 [Nyssa sinensis]|uniref:Glycosyltransferase n=1 Tax=Nyssa sinensis TaxID=561372 RepID=A0A5J5B9P5_9ASTE|nr:hypothetical protein F0562_025862 [Nyssa sinensis]
MDTKHSKISVLMFPWLAYGHISPYLELAKKLAKRNFFIYLCSTPINLSSIKKNIEEFSLPIELVELHLPTLPEPPPSPEFPPHYHTTNGLPPHLMSTLKKAFGMANENFYEILNTLKPDFLIYDILQPWAPAIAKQLNIPAIYFITTGAVNTSFMFHVLKDPSNEFHFPEIGLHGYESVTLTNFLKSSEKDSFTECFIECLKRSSEIVLIKSFREIEGKYIDYLSELAGKEIIPVGPIVKEPNNKDEQSDIIKWLDKKDESSTVFVSFGSEYFLSEMEMKEMGHGLELSNVNFIWVVRFPGGEKKRTVEEALPEGFLARIGKRGMAVEGWAPQGKILAHANIGGFVSHCGSSSLMESIKYGVPIIAIPMQLDQPINAKLVEHIGIGVEVVRDENGRLQGEKVATMTKNVVVEKNGKVVELKCLRPCNHFDEMQDLEFFKGDEIRSGSNGGCKGIIVLWKTIQDRLESEDETWKLELQWHLMRADLLEKLEKPLKIRRWSLLGL